MIDIPNRVKEACDNGHYACRIYVDFKKAFDIVNHNILLDKLAHYRVRQIKNNWFNAYLTNRKQHVTVSGQTFGNALIKSGVPQGPVLGPLLFLTYINDLNQAIKFGTVHHFAADTNLLLVGKLFKNHNEWASRLRFILQSTKKETQSWDWTFGKNKAYYSKALIENPLLFVI